jgi:hypothetical protein
MGDSWDVVYSLVSPGMWERMAFIYDKRKVRLGPMIASVVVMGEKQPLRTPYAVTFDVFGRRLTLCTVHIIWGDGIERRIEEIESLGKYFFEMSKHESAWKGSLILLGDFNSPDPNSPVIKAIRKGGFHMDPDMVSLPSNFSKSRVYDQIAFLRREDEEEGEKGEDVFHIGRVGVFDVFSDIFRDDEESLYRADMGESYIECQGDNKASTPDSRQRYYRTRWRTSQISDHFPKWVELRLLESDSEQDPKE